jgi:hypothetical protein
MLGEDGLALVSEPGPETSDGSNEEGYEFVGVIGGLDLTELGVKFSPGEAVGENACVFSLDTVKVLGVVASSAGRIDFGTVGTAFSRVSIAVEIKGLDLGDEVVNVIEIEADASEAR